MRTRTLLITIAGVAMAAACSSGPKPEAPAPEPTEAEMALQRHTQDSLDALSRATADSVVRVQAAERARADSAEQVRLAAETAARAAADETARELAGLRDELGALVYFDVAQARLQPDGRAVLDRKVAILNANPDVRLQITGACDERGSDEYNMALGERRAAEVKRYLVAQGISSARLDGVSSGEQSPVDSGKDEAAWSKNRRAEFVIVGGEMSVARQ